jgi:hypothetical protein
MRDPKKVPEDSTPAVDINKIRRLRRERLEQLEPMETKKNEVSSAISNDKSKGADIKIEGKKAGTNAKADRGLKDGRMGPDTMSNESMKEPSEKETHFNETTTGAVFKDDTAYKMDTETAALITKLQIDERISRQAEDIALALLLEDEERVRFENEGFSVTSYHKMPGESPRLSQEEKDYFLAVYMSRHGEMPPAFQTTGVVSPGAMFSGPSQITSNDTCVVCLERFKIQDMVTASCRHRYCRACIQGFFQRSIQDDQLFPPKCCQSEIDFSLMGGILPQNLSAAFERKTNENATPNRTYCSNPKCLKFILSQNIRNDRASCISCRTVTCSICKNAAHNGDCPADEALKQVLQLAVQEKWVRCRYCHRMIDLLDGCNHITVSTPCASLEQLLTLQCPCGFQFCYVCGVQWNEQVRCQCPLYPGGRPRRPQQYHLVCPLFRIQPDLINIFSLIFTCQAQIFAFIIFVEDGNADHEFAE